MIEFARHAPYRTPSEISPDEIFLDHANLPAFETAQFEGRLEQPLGAWPVYALGGAFVLIALIFGAQLWRVQVVQGGAYAERSRDNTLRTTPLFAERGEIFDRRDEPLAWNELSDGAFLKRRYTRRAGLAHLVGYLKYPTKDTDGFFIREDFEGVAGAEREMNDLLGGENGVRTLEYNVHGDAVSESEVSPPQRGADARLSIDARLSEALYGFLMERMRVAGFQGGAAGVLDVANGEIVALTSVPEYDPQALTDGAPPERIAAFVQDPHTPFLDRASAGLYAPGSTVKPLLAAAALAEKVIAPETEIVSTGSIAIPNPFAPNKFSVFNDWKAHGAVDMRKALAVSSDVYFYEIGGGFENQKGLGIERMEKYYRAFGLGETLADPLLGASSGVVPSPAWKERLFPGDSWRIGDTYNTAIGQYGMLATPLQMLRAIAAVANGGLLVEPTVLLGDAVSARRIPLADEYLRVAREGMRQAVTEGTASGLWFPFVSVAAKTGTAEVGIAKKRVHSWAVGFFPYENPRYAFVSLLERGPSENTVGSVFVIRQFFEWLAVYAPEYLNPAGEEV